MSIQVQNLTQLKEIVNKHDYFIIDRKAVSLHLDIVSLFVNKCVFYIDNPENSKNYEALEKAHEFFLQNKLRRDDSLIVMGGGATSDLGGFVASTILRGVSWNVFPTTLLAMVDAAIGGKVGINTNLGKNLIGNFHLPKNVYLYPEFLSSLDEVNLMSGKGEVLKYAFLSDSIKKLVLADAPMTTIITECASLKAEFVAKDFLEKGDRKLLNLGHTFGHAFEKCLNLPHGVAVSMGLELIISLYSPDLKIRFNEVKEKIGITLPKSKTDFSLFVKFLSHDKKLGNSGELDLIIPSSAGSASIESIALGEVIDKLENSEEYAHYFK